VIQARSQSPSLIRQALIAGIIGAIIVDTYLSIALHTSPVALEVRNARTAFDVGSPILGVIVHLVIALVWALIYAYVFNAIGQLRNWILGTIVLGVAVDAVMNLIIMLKTGAPWGTAFVGGLITNVVFYALPVALYLSLTAPRAHARRLAEGGSPVTSPP
jgi:hypothetical protein